jgi:hypothetical protein
MINKRRFVFDTNVVVSAFLFGQSKPRQALEDVLKVLDETDNLQKPNPPAPLPYEGRGVSKPLPASGRGLERGLFIH